MDESEMSLEGRMRALERVMRVFCLALILGVGGMAVRMTLAVPKFKQIFKDMLGSEDRLPGFTKLVINAAANPVVFVGVPIALIALGAFAAMKIPRHTWLVVYASCAGVLVLLWFALGRALWLPMIKIIQGVAGYP